MGQIKDRNYYQVAGWMINRLGLSGRELHAYAIIYGFTQDGETEFNGSINYIAEWLGSSRNTAISVLKSLIEKRLITKQQMNTPNGKRNIYAIVPLEEGSAETALGVVQKLDGGSAETALGVVQKLDFPSAKTAPNNNIYNNINNNIDNLQGSEPPETHPQKNEPIPYERIKKLYNNTCKTFPKIVSLSESRKRAIAARWKEYGGNLEVFEKLFTEAEASSFLKGANVRNWTATFDWLLKSTNMAKVLEGNYRDKGAGANANRGTASTGATRATDGNVRPPTTAELEEKLRREGTFTEYPDFDRIVAAHS